MPACFVPPLAMALQYRPCYFCATLYLPLQVTGPGAMTSTKRSDGALASLDVALGLDPPSECPSRERIRLVPMSMGQPRLA